MADRGATPSALKERADLIQGWLAGRQHIARTPVIPRADRSAPVRASSGQRRLWWQDHADGSAGERNVPFAWRLRGALSVQALFDAIDTVVGRQEALRTSFSTDGPELLQRVVAPYLVDRRVVDLSRRPAALADEVERATYRAFDLGRGDLLRARLFRAGPDEHVLLLVMPHLVVDDRSVAVLLEEIAEGYHAFRAGEPPRLTDLVIQYPDFAEWQRARLDSGALRESLDHWLRRLDGAPTVLELPADRPRRAGHTCRAGWVPFDVDPATGRGIAELARAERATPYMVLLAAYAAVLSRWSGARDLLIGSPVAGRTLPELEPLIGFFVNTVPMRVQVDPTVSFRTLLSEVRSTATAALDHHELPFDHLVKLLAPHRSAATNPLVQVAFSMGSATGTGLRLPGLTAEELPVPGRSSRYDLNVSVAARGDGFHGELIYDSEIFEEPTARWLAAAYLRTLAGMVGRPDVALLELDDVVAEPGPAQAGASAVDGPAVDVVARAAAWAAATPDALAVRAHDGDLTFADLHRYAGAVADRLQALGAVAGTAVGVPVDRSRMMLAAMLAVWRSEATAVLVDPALPPEALARIAEENGMRAVVAVPGSPLTGLHLPAVDPRSPDSGGDQRPAAAPHPDAVACVRYPADGSGATEVTYRNLADLASTAVSVLPPAGGLTATLLPPAAGAWLWSVLLPPAHGSGVVPVSPGDEFPAGVDVVIGTPAQLAHRMPPAAGLPATVVVTGEACPPTLAARWSARCRLVELYTPAGLAGPLALTDPRLLVLDHHLRPVRPGTPGELFVAGAGLESGYHGRAGRTASRLLPGRSGDGSRMLRTGDLARRRADGSVELIGPVAREFTQRGLRVLRSHIDAVAGTVAGVGATAVFPVPGSATAGIGLAVVPAGREPAGILAALSPVLEAELPDYLLPGHVCCVDALPTTAAGVCDEDALAALCLAGPATPVAEPPRTASEVLVAAVWSEVLARPVGGVDDDFFDLGGHSLLATQVLLALRRRTGVRLSIRQLFALRTVRTLAAALTEAGFTTIDQGES